MIVDQPKAPLGAVRRAVGIDPGSPVAHFCVLSRREEGPPEIVALESVRWRSEAPAEAAARIAEIVAGAERIAAESQFLRVSYHQSGAEAAGGYFGSLVKLAEGVGVAAGISAVLGGPGVVQVSPQTWRVLLSGLARRTKEEARRASLEGLRHLYPGAGPGRGGAWREGDHDLAAAYWIAAWALGYRSAHDFAPTWPPPGATAPPPRKPRAKGAPRPKA